MYNRYEHPDITRTLETGYCYDYEECPECGGAMGDVRYSIKGQWVCVECFKEWVADFVSVSPELAASDLGIEMERVQC